MGPDRGFRTALYEHRRRPPADDGSAVRIHLDKLVPLLGVVPLRPTRLYITPTVGLFGPTDPEAWFPYTEWGAATSADREHLILDSHDAGWSYQNGGRQPGCGPSQIQESTHCNPLPPSERSATQPPRRLLLGRLVS